MTLMQPITDEEFIGYLTAMLTDAPWGDPAADLSLLEEFSDSPLS